ncbi:MAG: hypothetical protein V7723_05945 [Sneathiella sp.]|uniref:hypothetical protein n=1 Tax=Sneathiella sp. TaxID=1964365 RepID=UPI003002A497
MTQYGDTKTALRQQIKKENRATAHGEKESIALEFNDTKLLSNRQKLGSIMKTAGDTIYLSFNTVAGIGAPVAIAVTLGVTGAGALIENVLSGNYLAMILAVTSTTALMSGSLSAGFLVQKNQFSNHLKAMEEHMRDQSNQKIRDQETKTTFARMMNEISESVSLLAEQVSLQNQAESSLSLCTSNQASTWTGWKDNSRLISVGGMAQCDVNEYRNGEGELRYKGDQERLINWLSRFMGEEKLNQIDLLFMEKDHKLQGDFRPPAALKRVLAAYKSVKQIAMNSGLEQFLDFSHVKVHLFPSEYQVTNAFFVGEKKIQNSSGRKDVVPVLIKYDSLGQVISSVTSILEPKVYISFDKEEIQSHRHLVDSWLPHASRTFSMNELMLKYEDQILLDECDYKLSYAELISLKLPIPEQMRHLSRTLLDDYQIIDSGDGSFSING